MIAITKIPIYKINSKIILVQKGVLGRCFIHHQSLRFQLLDSERHYPIAETQITRITTPLRVGRKQKRAILDANGYEVVIFREGWEGMATLTCELLNQKFENARHNKIHIL